MRSTADSTGHVEIDPVALSVTLQRRGSLVVAVPEAGPPVTRAADVDKTIRELRGGSASRNR